MGDLFELNVLWGSFDLHGNWTPNSNLVMSSDEQYRQNIITQARIGRRTPEQAE